MTDTLAPARAAGLLTRAPLAGRYAPAVAMALLALSPFIVLTTAASLVTEQLVADLGTTKLGVQLAAGLANALYAFGAVASADLVNRVSGRWLFLACEALFVVGSLLAALAGSIVLFTVGRSLQGLATGMLLVAALPPLITGHDAQKLPTSAALINLGLFGMVTLGPLVGGVAASTHGWRVMFAVVAGLGVLGFVVGLLAFRLQDPFRPGVGVDWLGAPVALAATVLPFVGVSFLTSSSFADPVFVAGVAVGLGALAFLIVAQLRKEAPLMPVQPISHTLPVTGIVLAMAVGAAFTGLLELTEQFLLQGIGRTPLTVGVLVTTGVAGVAIAAFAFRQLLTTRWLAALALSSVPAITVGAVLLLLLDDANANVIVPVAGLLLGYGAGAGVAPGLFMAGLSVPSDKLGPTFALVELLRSEAAFLLVPVVLHVALLGSSMAAGFRISVAILLGTLLLAGTFALAVLLLGGQGPHRPELDGWLGGDGPAFHSPRVFARLRGDK